jgi:hypothetical protein
MSDVDEMVSKVRRLSIELNHTLNMLQDFGVKCTSVIGSYNPEMRGMFREMNRVILSLDFTEKTDAR